MKFNTKVIHGGQHHDPSTGAVMPPVYHTSTFAQTSPGVHTGYEYSRADNPTRTALEHALESIENGARGLAFSSGLAAIDCVMRLLKPNDEVIAMDDLYGGTYRLFTRFYQDLGIKFHFINMNDLELFQSKINDKTKLVWIETPTNPLMKLADIEAIAQITKKHNILFAVDNTFATPYLQKPFLVLRGIKTLHLRVERHCFNGQKVAEFLEQHTLVEKVLYPGLPSHPQHDLAKKQMPKGFGGMVSFTFKSRAKEDAIKFLEKLRVFTLAESLGGVESLANHPALMTHASIPADKRAEIGVTDDMVRLSVGVEDIDDLLADLEQAFK